MIKIKFVVQCKLKKNQQTLKIVGNLPILGNWNPFNGLAMEQNFDGEWESIQFVQIPNGQQFQFKMVKINKDNSVEWQQLPHNANRRFKPRFHVKLMLIWNNNMGQVINDAKVSVKFNGLPGFMGNANKETGMLKRRPAKNKKSLLTQTSSSESQTQNDSFCNVINRAKSSDIRDSIDTSDIEEIYYETTQIQTAYHSYKKVQVKLVCDSFEKNKEFIQQIQEEVKELFQLENIHFRWLILNENPNSVRSRRLSIRRMQNFHEGKINIQNYLHKNVHKNHFIFVDIDSALRVQVGNNSACLYLPSTELERVEEHINELQKFQFICFDKGQTNKLLENFIKNKKNDKDKKGTHQEEIEHQNTELLQPDKQFYNITLEKVVEELQCCNIEQTSVNTVYSYTKNEALQNILQPNSVLIIDSQIMKTDAKFFETLTDRQIQKRLIIIMHNGGMAEWMTNYAECKNICVIFENYEKLYFFGKVYDPSLKHRNALDYIRMRAKLCEEEIGGSWAMNDKSFNYKIKQGTLTKFQKIKKQIENVLKKDFNYFKITMKETKIKIQWNFSNQVRLLRTLAKIKSIQEGQIGNFYLVSQKLNFRELKQQIKLLVNINYYWMINGKQTKVWDFGYGEQNKGKYNIKCDQVKTVNSDQSTSSKKSTQSKEQVIKDNKDVKIMVL